MKTARNKYRFEDRKSAEDAVERAEHKLILTNRMLNAVLTGGPIHEIEIGKFKAYLQTHHRNGNLLINPGLCVNSDTTDADWTFGAVCCPYEYIRAWADKSFSFDDHIGMGARDLACKIREHMKSIGAY